MTDALPEPMVPAEVDLRDYAYMPLDVVRLMRSSTWRKVRRHPELGYWMMNLWASSWHEVPAASLPDDDDELADFARCEPKVWDKVRGKVLAGWVKCNDGRLYHPVVAEKALEGWGKMALQRKQTHAAREAKKRKLLDAATKAAAEVATKTVASSVTEIETSSNRTERRGEEQNREEDQDAAASESPTAARDTGQAADDDLRFPAGLDRSVDRAYAQWSALATERQWPDTGFLNGERRAALYARLHEIGGLPGWSVVLEKLREAEFLNESDGTPKRWFNLGWMLKPENFTGLMEGRYAERRDHSQSRGNGPDPVADGIRESLARRSILAGG